MNRHMRRRARKLANTPDDEWLRGLQTLQHAATCANGRTWILQLNFYHLHQIHSDPEVLAAFDYWARHISINRPRCMTCRTHEWTGRTVQRPPAGIVIIQPWDHTKRDTRIICAVCDACIDHPELTEKIKNSVRRLAPDASFHEHGVA